MTASEQIVSALLEDEEEMSPEAMSRLITRTIPSERKMATSGARRLFGRAIVDRVEISSAEIGGKEGFHTIPKGWRGAMLEIYFFIGPELQVWRDYWMSRETLATALTRWTNLQGAKLVVDGEDAGTISPNNRILAKGGYL